MKNFLSSLIILICFLQSIISHAQNKSITISGIVLDSASNQPLPFVAIQIKEKPSRMSSHEDGSFPISCSVDDTLIFTHLGYNQWWNEEEGFKLLKSRMELRCHTRKTALVVLQDFHDKILLLTLTAVYTHSIEERVRQEFKTDEQREYPQKTN